MRPAVVVRAAAALLLALLAGGCRESPATPAPAARRTAKAPATATAAFQVGGMHCSTCPITVRMAARRVAGVADARVSLDEGKAWVTYDPNRTDLARIVAAITESGYRATLLESRHGSPR